MTGSKFNETINIWIQALDQYSYQTLCTRPHAQSWSVGQVYIHLLNDTGFYIEQIKTCISTNNHASEEASPNAKALLLVNDFPDLIIEGHPNNAFIPQPSDKKQLQQSFEQLKNEMNALEKLIEKTSFTGKTKHPGFMYLGAREWFQLAEMHFRHHLRQKKRIDDFLKTNGFSPA